jgi:hypothetical protein
MRISSSPEGKDSPATSGQAVRPDDAKIANAVSSSLVSFFEDVPIWEGNRRRVVILRDDSLEQSEIQRQEGSPSEFPVEREAVPLASGVIGEGAVHKRVVASFDEMQTIQREVRFCHSADAPDSSAREPIRLEFEMLKVWAQHETSYTCRIQELCFGIMIALQSMPQQYNFLNCTCQSCQYFQESMRSTMRLVDERCERPTDSVMDSELQKRDTGRLLWFAEKLLEMVDAHLPSSNPLLQGYRGRVHPFWKDLVAIIQRREKEPARCLGDKPSAGEVKVSRELQQFEMLKIWASREVQDTCRMQQVYFNIYSAQKKVPSPRDLFNPINPLFQRFSELMSRLKQLVDERRERFLDSVMDSTLQKNDTGRLRWFERKYSELVGEQVASFGGRDPALAQILHQMWIPRDALVELIEKRTKQEPVEYS